ncbi:MAG: DUF11 domain-containing protein, partial [Clostridiales bacterium]|nr:DUF11 domain-containing protein [Clostridiales bacterium]
MATISGSILFDKERTADAPQGLPGIANVPVILQNTATNAALAVLTDSAGHYTFTNVPDGDYRIVEAYGAAASASPGDFQTAAATNPAAAAFPPVSAAPDAPASATNLDATTPATLVVRISGSDMQGLNILNGPVRYTPIRAISDTGLSIDPKNLIDRPGYADFGSFPPGTPANTGADPNPYPDIGSGFVYTLPGNVQVTPAFHEYTIQNLMNNSIPNIQYTWWRVADHTTGNETGRMMVINGDVPGSVIYEQQVSVKPDTFYLFSSWILNLSRSVTLADPKLGVQVLNGSGQVLYSATLGELIPMNPENPEWKQIGTVINSGSNSALTVRFTSMGPEANGNDYAIDDIALNEVDVEAYTPGKSSNKSTAGIGETVEYSVTLKNTGINPLTNVTVRDAVPDGFTFVPGSVVVNGILESNANPGTGLPVPDIPGGGNLTVTFLARADRIPAVNPAVNSAAVTYSYSPVNGGIPDVYNRTTNPVSIRILQADISVTKTSYPNPVQAGTRITYTVSVVNNGPTEAQSVVLTDTPPEAIENPEYSSDGGETWQAWGGSLALGDMASNARRDVIIRGKVSNSAAGSLINTAIAASPTPDPNPDNNTVTEITPVITSADVSITKKADKNPAEAGGVLTYTLTITNNGPNDAQNVVVTDNVPAALTAAEYSSDGGVSWNPWGGSLALGTAPSGAALEIRLRGTVSGAAAGSISNTAAVTSSTPDPNPDNTRTTVDIPVVVPYIPKADVSVTKKADKSSVQAGD